MLSYNKSGAMRPVAMTNSELKSILYVNTAVNGDGEREVFGNFTVVPNPAARECMFIAGPSGSGKTTQSKSYIQKFTKMWPQREVYVFAPESVADDYKGMKKVYVVSDFNDITMDDIPNDSLVVFDDIDSMEEASRQILNKLRDTILETGRHKNIYCIITSHLLIKSGAGDVNKRIYNECQLITIFPLSGNRKVMMKILSEQVGLDANTIKKIMNIRSRWVTVNKTYPPYYVSETSVGML